MFFGEKRNQEIGKIKNTTLNVGLAVSRRRQMQKYPKYLLLLLESWAPPNSASSEKPYLSTSL